MIQWTPYKEMIVETTSTHEKKNQMVASPSSTRINFGIALMGMNTLITQTSSEMCPSGNNTGKQMHIVTHLYICSRSLQKQFPFDPLLPCKLLVATQSVDMISFVTAQALISLSRSENAETKRYALQTLELLAIESSDMICAQVSL